MNDRGLYDRRDDQNNFWTLFRTNKRKNIVKKPIFGN